MFGYVYFEKTAVSVSLVIPLRPKDAIDHAHASTRFREYRFRLCGVGSDMTQNTNV